MGRGLTKQDYLKSGAGTDNDLDVAQRLGVSRQAVSAMRRKHGIASASERGVAERKLLLDKATALSAQGMPISDICKVLGMNPWSFRKAEEENRIKLPRHQGNRDRKYTDAMILSSIRSSRTMAAAAIKLGMNQPGIYAAIHNRGLDAKVSELLDAKGCRTFANGARYPANRKPNKK